MTRARRWVSVGAALVTLAMPFVIAPHRTAHRNYAGAYKTLGGLVSDRASSAKKTFCSASGNC